MSWKCAVSLSGRPMAAMRRIVLPSNTNLKHPTVAVPRFVSGKAAKAILSKSNRSRAVAPKNEKLLKPPDPEKEDEIRQLQYEVRAHHEHGHYSEALKSSLVLLQVTLDHFGKDHPASASAFNNVGLMHKLLGQYEQSRHHYHDALRIYGRVVGKDHASYAAALHNLGNLNRSQLHFDESLSAIDRLQLNEEAMSYLEEAWVVRQAELGDEHPHTISSRSNLGSAMAAQVLQVQTQQLELQKIEWKNNKEGEGKSNSEATAPPLKKPSKWTMKRWEAAEQHLRASLVTAIENPRGSQVTTKKDSKSTICSLSAANTAQNLAVFLKSLATLQAQKNEEALTEAKSLYEQVLEVRKELLSTNHPDTVATKFSLAELLSVVGDEDGANAIREEILESHGEVIMVDDANTDGASPQPQT